MTEQDTMDGYAGKPFDESLYMTLGYVIRMVDIPESEYDEEMETMCATCARPEDVLKAISKIPDQEPFGNEVPYPECDFCGYRMTPDYIEEVDRDEVVALYEESL